MTIGIVSKKSEMRDSCVMTDQGLTISRKKTAYRKTERTGSTLDQVTDVLQAAHAKGCIRRTGGSLLEGISLSHFCLLFSSF